MILQSYFLIGIKWVVICTYIISSSKIKLVIFFFLIAMQLIGRILCYCLNALPKFVCWKHPQCNCGKEARPDRKWLDPQEQSNVLMRRVSHFRTGLWCTGACCFLTLLLLHLPLPFLLLWDDPSHRCSWESGLAISGSPAWKFWSFMNWIYSHWQEELQSQGLP